MKKLLAAAIACLSLTAGLAYAIQFSTPETRFFGADKEIGGTLEIDGTNYDTGPNCRWDSSGAGASCHTRLLTIEGDFTTVHGGIFAPDGSNGSVTAARDISAGDTMSAGTMLQTPIVRTHHVKFFAGDTPTIESEPNVGAIRVTTGVSVNVLSTRIGQLQETSQAAFVADASTIPAGGGTGTDGIARLDASGLTLTNYGGTTFSEEMTFIGIGGTNTSSAPTGQYQPLGIMGWTGYNGTAATPTRFPTRAGIVGMSVDTWTATSMPAQLNFWTTKENVPFPPRTRMIISSTGPVYMGQLGGRFDTDHSLNPDAQLDVTPQPGITHAIRAHGNVRADGFDMFAGSFTGSTITLNGSNEPYTLAPFLANLSAQQNLGLSSIQSDLSGGGFSIFSGPNLSMYPRGVSAATANSQDFSTLGELDMVGCDPTQDANCLLLGSGGLAQIVAANYSPAFANGQANGKNRATIYSTSLFPAPGNYIDYNIFMTSDPVNGPFFYPVDISTEATIFDVATASSNIVMAPNYGRVGIGTSSPASTLDVAGDVTVQGSVLNGWERVSNNCAAATTCTVSCSAGKTLTGGGCNSNGQVLASSYPSSDSQWTCDTTLATSIDVYAICSRIGP